MNERAYERVLGLLWHAARLITRANPEWVTDLPVRELVFNHAVHKVHVPFHAALCIALPVDPSRACVVFFSGGRDILEGYWLVGGCSNPYVEAMADPITEVPWQLVGLEHVWPVPRRGQQILDLPFVSLVIRGPVLQ
jgi:hypothetical protein